MELKRKPFQGVVNIIRFNWHFYLIAFSGITLVLILSPYLSILLKPYILLVCIILCLNILISLCISFYIYDCSNLYQFNWFIPTINSRILNVHAGFDETSAILKQKLPANEIVNCDFYDPQKHTEVSIERARRAYPQPEDTIQVSTENLPFADATFDHVLLILSAHEIRNAEERIVFFKELHRITKLSGKIFVTEHLRDIPNFLAYAVGFFHFHSRASWLQVFKQAGFITKREIKTTPFITTFMLEKNGDSI